MSRLRARCPDCRTLTAVALGPDYECHACGATWGAALVRIEPAEPLDLPWPDAGVGELPARPIVLAADHEAVAATLGARLVRLSDPEPDLTAPVYVLLDGPPPPDAERVVQRIRDGAPVLGAGVRDLTIAEATRLLRLLRL